MKKLILILASVFIFIGKGLGADWKFLYGFTTGERYFYDAESLRRDPVSKRVKVWVESRQSKESCEQVVEIFGNIFNDISKSLQLLEYDFVEKRSRTLQAIIYDTRGVTSSEQL